jgi:TonB family protein
MKKQNNVLRGLSVTLGCVATSLAVGGCAAVFAGGHSKVQVTLREPAPSPVFQPPPEYPPSLRRWNVPGNAIVDFMVDQNGKVHDAQSAKYSDPQFAVAAVTAVRQWKYQPGAITGPQAAMHLRVRIDFTMTPASPRATVSHDPPAWADPTYGGGHDALPSRGDRVP